MNKFKRALSVLGNGLLCGVVFLFASAGAARAAGAGPEQLDAAEAADLTSGHNYLLRVYVGSNAEIQELIRGHYDVLESRGRDFVHVMGGDRTIQRLQAEHRLFDIERVESVPAWFSPDTYYGGYLTVDEMYAHLDTVLAAYPTLTQGVIYGQSWVVTHPNTWPPFSPPIQPPGYPLRAVCITANANAAGACSLTPTPYPLTPGVKPRYFLMGAIHARELTTMEMNKRWIDYLTTNYGVDPDVTMLLDNYELWVVPTTNPDGRWLVEWGGNSPLYQRKNANNSAGSSCSVPPNEGDQPGVDLNRNSSFEWNHGGSSGFACDQTYYGTSAASEPETQAVEALLAQLFPALRGPNPSDPSPLDYPGAMLTQHTFADLVIFPYACPNDAGDCGTSFPRHAPNDDGLYHFAYRMSYYLQGGSVPPPAGWPTYATGQCYEILYAVSGNTDDYCYGALGTPAFTTEMGPGPNGGCTDFLPPYDCQDGNAGFPGGFWGIARPNFLYMAKNSRNGFQTALGPTALPPSPNIFYIHPGDPFTLSTTVANDTFGSDNSNPSHPPPTPLNVTGAEYYVDNPPWAPGATPNAMSGTFGTPRVNVSGVVNTAPFADGERHTLFFRGQGSDASWGAPSAVFLYVSNTFDDLSATQSIAPSSTCGGGAVTITATVHNAGPDDAQSVTFTDVFAAGSTNVAASGAGWSCASGATVVCTMPTLANGASSTVTITLNVPASGALFTNFVSVASTTPDQNPTNNNASSSITINPILLSPSILPNGGYGTNYNQQLTVSGGGGPFTFSVTSGALPNGITLSSAGLLSGPPTEIGTFNFTVTATDGVACTGSHAYALTINCGTVTISPGTLPHGQTGVPYSQTFTASGGPGPFTFALVGGTLPAGLTLDSAGNITGTPTTGGTSFFTVRATDPNNCTVQSAYGLTIDVAFAVVSISPQCGDPAGGTSVTINGFAFDPAATVTIGGNAATGVVVNGAGTQITANTPANSPGVVGDVVVNNAGPTATITNGYGYDYLDVPTSNPFHSFVCSIERNQITGGCGGGNYCPNASIIRSQMAVFIIRAEHGSAYTPPAANCGTFPFTDVACPSVIADYVQQMVAEGITGGCSPTTFCPNSPVLRNQMAVFLLTGEHGTGYTPSACTPPGQFTDVPCPGSGFTDWIYQLVAEGITGGCTATTYCPNNTVTRASMAVFLTTTFSLP